MSTINNTRIYGAMPGVSGSGLTNSDVNTLRDIFAGAVRSNDLTNATAGRGYMGLASLNGKPVTVKFMTHLNELGYGFKRDSAIMKEVDASAHHERAFKASEHLEKELISLARKVGVEDLVDKEISQYKSHVGRMSNLLLSRKVVFKAASLIRDAVLARGGDIDITPTNVSRVDLSSKGKDTSVDNLGNMKFDDYDNRNSGPVKRDERWVGKMCDKLSGTAKFKDGLKDINEILDNYGQSKITSTDVKDWCVKWLESYNVDNNAYGLGGRVTDEIKELCGGSEALSEQDKDTLTKFRDTIGDFVKSFATPKTREMPKTDISAMRADRKTLDAYVRKSLQGPLKSWVNQNVAGGLCWGLTEGVVRDMLVDIKLQNVHAGGKKGGITEKNAQEMFKKRWPHIKFDESFTAMITALNGFTPNGTQKS